MSFNSVGANLWSVNSVDFPRVNNSSFVCRNNMQKFVLSDRKSIGTTEKVVTFVVCNAQNNGWTYGQSNLFTGQFAYKIFFLLLIDIFYNLDT